MRTLVWLTCLPLAFGAFDANHLRSQPTAKGSLATDAVVKSVPKVAGTPKSLVSVARKPKEEIDVHKNEEKDDREALTDFKSFGLMSAFEIFLGFITWFILYILLAMYYKKNVLFYAPEDVVAVEKEQREHYKDFQQFRSGLFECTTYPGITFWSCCCPGLRWADTMSKVGIHRFYEAFAIMTILWSLMWIPIASALCFVIVVIYMTIKRQALREKFEFEEQGTGAALTDCLSYFCCMCCAVAQEARHTREACQAGHPAMVPPTPREEEAA